MAQKRMFSLQIIDTDRFMDMSTSAQALYFHLGMHGDDDGFVASPRKLVRAAGCNDDDLRLLAAKGYIIPFDSGVIVVTDWNINNTLKNDRYHETVYVEEKAKLSVDKAGRYILGTDLEPKCFQTGTDLESEPNLTQPNVTKQSVEGAGKPPRATRFTPPTLEEVTAYVCERNSKVDPQGFIDFYAAKGWKIGTSPMKDWKAACRNAEKWERWDRAPAADRNRLRSDSDYQSGNDFFGGV